MRDGAEIVFVRHAYGDREIWELPGGGMRRGEAPAATARREVREELGVDLAEWREVRRVEVDAYHKRTVVHLLEADAAGRPLVLDEAEIAAARWAAVDAPPEPLGPFADPLLRVAGHG